MINRAASSPIILVFVSKVLNSGSTICPVNSFPNPKTFISSGILILFFFKLLLPSKREGKYSYTIQISKIQLKKSEQEFSHIINKYTKLDPTLPRVSNILCPNPDCATNKDKDKEQREIISIRYDDTNMKYVYLCSTCNTVWKTEDQS